MRTFENKELPSVGKIKVVNNELCHSNYMEIIPTFSHNNTNRQGLSTKQFIIVGEKIHTMNFTQMDSTL